MLFTQHCSGDEVDNSVMGRACSTKGERCIQGFGGET